MEKKRVTDDNVIRFSIIIPCYNEEDALQTTIVQIDTQIQGVVDYEIIVVDDGSTDRTPNILNELTGQFARLKVLRHERNQGYGAALKLGIRAAKNEVIVITDADNTYPVEHILQLVEYANNFDMVVGARTGPEVVYSRLRRIPKLFLKWYCSWIVGQKIPDINSGLRVLKKDIVERFMNILPNGFSFTTTITLAMMTNFYRVKFVPINYSVRSGESKISPIKDTLRFIQLIVRTGTYFAPIRVLMPLICMFFIMFITSLLYDVFFLKNLTDKTVLFLLFGINTGMFALIADMIDKRISS